MYFSGLIFSFCAGSILISCSLVVRGGVSRLGVIGDATGVAACGVLSFKGLIDIDCVCLGSADVTGITEESFDFRSCSVLGLEYWGLDCGTFDGLAGLRLVVGLDIPFWGVDVEFAGELVLLPGAATAVICATR